MQLRPMTPADLAALDEIDATIESASYLHVDRERGEGLSAKWSVGERPLRERMIEPNRLSDEGRFMARQIASGADEGVAMVADHDGQIVGMVIAQMDPARRTLNVVDLRVDYDFRRQGLGLALLFELITVARQQELRAVKAETPTNNFPAIQLFRKVEFELAGLDTHRHSNHDLVKEAVTLIWYAALD
jgi:ribosomal protein S18 acetylase RimI-like enzyme